MLLNPLGAGHMRNNYLFLKYLSVYASLWLETTPWCTEEIGRFQYALRRHEKDFHRVSKELQACGMDKSVKACVEFYYVWKRMNTRREVNSRSAARIDEGLTFNLAQVPFHSPPFRIFRPNHRGVSTTVYPSKMNMHQTPIHQPLTNKMDRWLLILLALSE
ncbi:unnamed protein product [Dibothriocephalus latus]|uniref:SANT domain-containing protein n=1 Tax=Dibothriocephalus latus TaxID=60516 RepID=A0A3P6R9S7_DIBLA|nr:unnamed protein product [Dibothriocephalus latus]